MFRPRFTLSPAITKALMEIEACRQTLSRLPLTVRMLDSLRKTARLLSTHFSTQIEGNKLSPSQVEEVLAGGGKFPGRARDEAEVRNYYEALQFVVAQAAGPAGPAGPEAIAERTVRTIHGLVMTGKKRPTPYRAGQNVIRNGRTGAIVYLPPEAKDVPGLMKDLVAWIVREMRRDELPVPVIAGLAHYQFATIHPYFDGNGRTARLLTTLILHRGGYGLHGIYSLEEYYAKHLDGYYGGLAIGKSHNYYMGRAAGDITPFLRYFCTAMADSFAAVRSRAEEAQRVQERDETASLRELTAQQRKALSLFLRSKTVSSRDMAEFFGISGRAGSDLCARWVKAGFLAVADRSKKARRYQLADRFEEAVTHDRRNTLPESPADAR